MHCTNCGTLMEGNTTTCPNCGQTQTSFSGTPPVEVGPYPTPANAGLAPSILVTLFCCMPAGVVAIVFSAMAMGKNSSGDFAGAHRDAKVARTWTWVSFGIGLAIVVVYLGFILLSVVLAGAAGTTGP